MDNTGIEWTRGDDGTPGATWNPVRGCSLVSAGCTNCYAMKRAHRFSVPTEKMPAPPYEGLTKPRDHGGPVWTGVVREVPEMLDLPLRWKRPRRIFVNSMSDLFHEGVSNEYIAAVFGVMAACPQHTFQILTKRPERMRAWFDWLDAETDGGGRPRRCGWYAVQWLGGIGQSAMVGVPLPSGAVLSRKAVDVADATISRMPAWPLPNVWLGVSVEDQKTADARIPHLLDVPNAVPWVSYEPGSPSAYTGHWRDSKGALHEEGYLAARAIHVARPNLTDAEIEADAVAILRDGKRQRADVEEDAYSLIFYRGR